MCSRLAACSPHFLLWRNTAICRVLVVRIADFLDAVWDLERAAPGCRAGEKVATP